MNRCPGDYYGDPRRACSCSVRAVSASWSSSQLGIEQRTAPEGVGGSVGVVSVEAGAALRNHATDQSWKTVAPDRHTDNPGPVASPPSGIPVDLAHLRHGRFAMSHKQ